MHIKDILPGQVVEESAILFITFDRDHMNVWYSIERAEVCA